MRSEGPSDLPIEADHLDIEVRHEAPQRSDPQPIRGRQTDLVEEAQPLLAEQVGHGHPNASPCGPTGECEQP
jgi:hypothetical protein